MDAQSDPFVQQHMEEFKEQLAAMAQHQNQALAMICAERLRQDLRPATQPLNWRQRLQGAYQQIRRQFVSSHLQTIVMVEKPNEDAVVVIDATYSVVSSDTTQDVKPTTGKED